MITLGICAASVSSDLQRRAMGKLLKSKGVWPNDERKETYIPGRIGSGVVIGRRYIAQGSECHVISYQALHADTGEIPISGTQHLLLGRSVMKST
jgi:hypothetical protein